MNTSSDAAAVGQLADDLQARAAWALADLVSRGPHSLSWSVPQERPGTLTGVRDTGEIAERVDVVDAWADLLGVTAEWRTLPDRGGEYVAEVEHLGARVSVRAWLPDSPGEVELDDRP
ncbi:hypothetical protein [Nonomuraea angiospora]|uniref:hypothetical protein n=1 Tax=Nonomuraea angiospora TaxID=46172 RepID=UPI0029B66B01|nr:hypothetical protein [Nonomuraea angiospora]MDX3100500.1 hypothetical protein [Nonomuraea angiospora]